MPCSKCALPFTSPSVSRSALLLKCAYTTCGLVTNCKSSWHGREIAQPDTPAAQSGTGTREKRARAQPWKEWHRRWGKEQNCWEPARSKTAEDVTSNGLWASLHVHCSTVAKWGTHGLYGSPEADHMRTQSGQWPAPGNSALPPKQLACSSYTLAYENYPVHENEPPHMWGPLCPLRWPTPSRGVCFSQSYSCLFETHHILICGMRVSK